MARPSLYARSPADPAEERRLRRLAVSRHAPASWIQRARIITDSWDGSTVPALRTAGLPPQDRLQVAAPLQ